MRDTGAARSGCASCRRSPRTAADGPHRTRTVAGVVSLVVNHARVRSARSREHPPCVRCVWPSCGAARDRVAASARQQPHAAGGLHEHRGESRRAGRCHHRWSEALKPRGDLANAPPFPHAEAGGETARQTRAGRAHRMTGRDAVRQAPTSEQDLAHQSRKGDAARKDSGARMKRMRGRGGSGGEGLRASRASQASRNSRRGEGEAVRERTAAEKERSAAFDRGEAPAPSVRARWLRVVREDGVTLAYTTSRETAERLAAVICPGASVTDKRVVRRGRPSEGPLT